MTTFVTQQGARRFLGGIAAGAIAAMGICLAGAMTAPAARADTQGVYNVNGNGVLRAFGYGALLNVDGTATTAPTVVDLTQVGYSYITNDYIGAVIGLSGTFTVNYGTNSIGSVSYNVPGRIAFGNRAGSLVRGAADDNRALTGFGDIGEPYPVFPLASDAFVPAKAYYDYSGYVSAIVDSTGNGTTGGTVKHFLNTADFVVPMLFQNNTLDGTLDAGNNIRIRQVIRLMRSTARLEWTITNRDTATHTVGLRLALNLRNSVASLTDRSSAVYFVDPVLGRTSKTRLYRGSNVPTQIDVLKTRVDQDPAITGNSGDFPYHARHILSGFGATTPDQVLVADSAFLRSNPAPTTYAPQIGTAASLGNFNDGLATALYWNPVTIAPGGSRTIVTYFGNGAATEDLSRLDFVTGTEARESIGFDTSAASLPAFQDGRRDDPAKSLLFYKPSNLKVYGSIYNRSIADPQLEVIFRNVTMSLNLPTGLEFVNDTTQKIIGDVRADKDAQVNWNIRANGQDYGALTYQMVTSIPGIGTSTLSRVINVPATPLHPVVAAFQMISFPFEFNPTLSNGGDPQTVLNGINSPNSNAAAIYQYRPEISNYINLGANEQSTDPATGRRIGLQPGIGYFYNPGIARTIVAKGVIPLANQAPDGRGNATPASDHVQCGLEHDRQSVCLSDSAQLRADNLAKRSEQSVEFLGCRQRGSGARGGSTSAMPRSTGMICSPPTAIHWCRGRDTGFM